MFKKIIAYLLEKGGYTEGSIGRALGCSQSTVNRIKSGQMPKYSDGVKLREMYEEVMRASN